VFEALRTHDYPAFAAQQLKEREEAAMPPFCLPGTGAGRRPHAGGGPGFSARRQQRRAQAHGLPGLDQVTLYPPVPLTIQRVAQVERAQMLVESSNRTALQRFLAAWQPVLQATRSQPEHKGLVRWLVDVDPLAI
jgi:primosomal protein N' (replication factor Y)